MTTMAKITRIDKDVFVTYVTASRTLLKICAAETPELASWIANAIAGYHRVSLEEREE